MFDIGFGELLLIAVVALVVLGPERLPGAARTAGALLRRLRESWGSVRDEVERELQADELRRRLRETQQQAREAADAMRSGVHRVGDDLRRAVDPQASADRENPGDGARAEEPSSRDGDDHGDHGTPR